MELGVRPKTTLYMIGLIDLCGIEKHLNQFMNIKVVFKLFFRKKNVFFLFSPDIWDATLRTCPKKKCRV